MRVHPVSLWGRSTPCGESGLAAGRTLAPRALRVRPLCEEGALAAGRTRPLPERCLSEALVPVRLVMVYSPTGEAYLFDVELSASWFVWSPPRGDGRRRT